MRFILVILCFFLIQGVFSSNHICESQNTCYYVSPSGSGIGTYSDPGNFETIKSQLSAGDIVYFLDGVYTQSYISSGENAIIMLDKYVSFSNPQPTSLSPVIIKGYPGTRPIIRGDGTSIKCAFIDGISNLIIENLIFEECYDEGIQIGYDVPEENITLRNIEVRNVTYYDNSGFITTHSYKNVIIENSTFHDYAPGQVGAYLKFFDAIDVTVRYNEFYGRG